MVGERIAGHHQGSSKEEIANQEGNGRKNW